MIWSCLRYFDKFKFYLIKNTALYNDRLIRCHGIDRTTWDYNTLVSGTSVPPFICNNTSSTINVRVCVIYIICNQIDKGNLTLKNNTAYAITLITLMMGTFTLIDSMCHVILVLTRVILRWKRIHTMLTLLTTLVGTFTLFNFNVTPRIHTWAVYCDQIQG